MTKPLALGIIGHPIGHTLSPVMHKTAAKSHGIDLTYDAFDIKPENLESEIARLRDLPLDGFNVTVPHKVAVMEYMDELTGDARLIGAVNTVVNQDGRLIGHNTDAYGFITSVTKNGDVDLANKSVFVYGAGGAAMAVCVGLAQAKAAKIVIANRTEDKATKLAERIFQAFGQVQTEAVGYDSNKLVETISTADIIVNTTSIGLEGGDENQTLPGADNFSGSLLVDIVYKPLETEFLKSASAKDIKTLDGLWMLIHQGDQAFWLWTKKRFPVDLIRVTLIEELG